MANKIIPEQVFTPRAAEVNHSMYVNREYLEQELKNSLRTGMHVIIHGLSGSGKSWLCKSYFQTNKIKYEIANLANGSRLGSINAELKNLVDRKNVPVKVGYEENKNAGLNILVATANINHNGQYQITTKEPFELCLEYLSNSANNAQSILVFDNLEAVIDDDKLLAELANLILLCDDENYSKYNVKIMIVGVPSGIKEYFYKTPNSQSVSNRLYELPEVSRLSKEECDTLISKGFLDILKYNFDNYTEFKKHVAWVTGRVPQMVHEYCLTIATQNEITRNIKTEYFVEADKRWIKQSLSEGYSVIENSMNERDTRAGRRNQVLYSIGLCELEEFKVTDIENIFRNEFIQSRDANVNLNQVLAKLAEGKMPVVKRSPKGDAYQLVDAKYQMVIRLMLQKNSNETIEKVQISKI